MHGDFPLRRGVIFIAVRCLLFKTWGVITWEARERGDFADPNTGVYIHHFSVPSSNWGWGPRKIAPGDAARHRYGFG